ncbi:hypothetical protein [Haloarchaeobius sp. DYHT-AS-18]|uniref:hypothetical protein n=1 Tax=Haloarchaeobius sp. DYHT-AS-18 TaxID=3446117 RepID=UPI003EBF35F5
MEDESLDPSEYKVYWFARDLVASAYGNYATKETNHLRGVSRELEQRYNSGQSLSEVSKYLQHTIPKPVTKMYAGDISKRYRQTEDLTDRLIRRLETREDIYELHIATEAVVRVSEILDATASFGREEIEDIVEETLIDNREIEPEKAYEALYRVDFEGEAYQLGAQRQPLVSYVNELMEELEEQHGMESEEVARILSSVVQEYERRAGQSRAATAGNVLEVGLQHVFRICGIPATGTPQHYGDLEVDNVVEGPAGSIGFSCKRTLRERFRQSLSRQSEIGVDEIWFVSLMMADVSREKLRDIAEDGGRLYVPRDSFVWTSYSNDPELENALRPADQFLLDVERFTGHEIEEIPSV